MARSSPCTQKESNRGTRLDMHSAEYLGDDVSVIVWEKKRKHRKGGQKKTKQRIRTMCQISEFKNAYMRVGTKLVTMSSVVQARTWRCHALALPECQRYKNIGRKWPAQQGRINPRRWHCIWSMGVEHAMATTCALAWAQSCWDKKNEEVLQRVWKFTMANNVSWKTCRGLGSCVRLQ